MNFNNLEKIKDSKKNVNYLFDNLNADKLQIINNILTAYKNKQIFLNMDYCGGSKGFKVFYADKSYKRTKYELIVLMWFTKYVDADYLCYVLNEKN